MQTCANGFYASVGVSNGAHRAAALFTDEIRPAFHIDQGSEPGFCHHSSRIAEGGELRAVR